MCGRYASRNGNMTVTHHHDYCYYLLSVDYNNDNVYNEMNEHEQRINPEGFKRVTEVAKAGAAKWSSLSPEEKKPYEDDAAERKV